MSVLNVLGVTALPELLFYTNEREFGEERVGRGRGSQKHAHTQSVSFN